LPINIQSIVYEPFSVYNQYQSILSYFVKIFPDIKNNHHIIYTKKYLQSIYYKNSLIYMRIEEDFDFKFFFKFEIINHIKNLRKTFINNIMVKLENYKYHKNMLNRFCIIYLNKDHKILKQDFNKISYYYNYIHKIKYKYNYMFTFIKGSSLCIIVVHKYNYNMLIFIHKKTDSLNIIYEEQYNKYKQHVILIHNKYELQYYSKYLQCL